MDTRPSSYPYTAHSLHSLACTACLHAVPKAMCSILMETFLADTCQHKMGVTMCCSNNIASCSCLACSVPSASLCCGMQKCVAVKAFDTALEALQRAQEIGLQFFRGDAYFAVMKGAVLNKQLDIAIKYVLYWRACCMCALVSVCPCACPVALQQVRIPGAWT